MQKYKKSKRKENNILSKRRALIKKYKKVDKSTNNIPFCPIMTSPTNHLFKYIRLNSVTILRDIRNCPIERYIHTPLFYRTCFSYSAFLLRDSIISKGS